MYGVTRGNKNLIQVHSPNRVTVCRDHEIWPTNPDSVLIFFHPGHLTEQPVLWIGQAGLTPDSQEKGGGKTSSPRAPGFEEQGSMEMISAGPGIPLGGSS